MQPKKILLINDLPGFGKVALAAMVPILSGMGHHTYQLPTAVLSNTLDYGKYEMADMTAYMRGALKVWDELGIDPDCIATGFIVSEEQADIILDYINGCNKGEKRFILVDPIMGDGGRLYNGVGPERVSIMRRLAASSDVMVPNFTEAEFLSGESPDAVLQKKSADSLERRELTRILHNISGKSVVITGVLTAGSNGHRICGYDHIRDEYFEIPYESLPVKAAGSGDIFSALLLCGLLEEKPLMTAAEEAAGILSGLICESGKDPQDYKGIIIEKYWKMWQV